MRETKNRFFAGLRPSLRTAFNLRQSQDDFAEEEIYTALCASMYKVHFDARSVRSVFSDAHVAGENLLNLFFRSSEKLCEAFSVIRGRPPDNMDEIWMREL